MVRIHFLNVGHGDCTIIEHASGRRTMIDINVSADFDKDSMRELMEESKPTPTLHDLLVGSALQIPGLGANPQNMFPDQIAGYKVHGLGSALMEFLKSDADRLKDQGYKIPLTNPVDYYLSHWGKQPLFRYIQTHPDMDHMRGLHQLMAAGVEIVNMWDTNHTKTITDFISDADKAAWDAYQRFRTGDAPSRRTYTRGTKQKYFNAGAGADIGDGLEILAPTAELCAAANEKDDHNGHSYVLRLRHAGTDVIFGGDATEAVWEDIHAHYGNALSCAVLKASHHGRDSGYYRPAVEAMNPQFTIVSVGKKPDTDASNKYKNYTTKGVWSTRWRGNIIHTINDDGTGLLTPQY